MKFFLFKLLREIWKYVNWFSFKSRKVILLLSRNLVVHP